MEAGFGEKHFHGNRHHRAGGEAVPQPPFGICIQVGGQNLYAGFFDRGVLVGQLDVSEGIVVFNISPVGIFAGAVMIKVLKIHVHHDLVGGIGGLRQDIEDTAGKLIVSAVKQIGVKLGATGKKCRAALGIRKGCSARQTVEKLFYMNLQSLSDIVEGFDIYGNLSFFIFGDSGFAFADLLGQNVQGHMASFSENTDLLSDFRADFGHGILLGMV